MYVGVVGTPVPIRMHAIATNSRPKKILPPDSVTRSNGSMARNHSATCAASSITAPEKLKPSPESVSVPRIRPTQAQAAPIASAYFAPTSRPSISGFQRQRLALELAPAHLPRERRQVRADEAQDDAPERRHERREVEQQHRDQRDQRKHEVPALADHLRQSRDQVRLDAVKLQALRLEVDHRQAGEVVEQRRHDGDDHEDTCMERRAAPPSRTRTRPSPAASPGRRTTRRPRRRRRSARKSRTSSSAGWSASRW